MRHLISFITMTLVYQGLGQDIVFPQNEEGPQLSGNNPVITERIPVYIPTRCPENMLLYPGPGPKSSWVCDCKPKFLYFPTNNTCHEAYRQGPCLPGNYVYLPEGEVVPRCAENPCSTDGLVPFDGGCHALGTAGPCGPSGSLGINAKTFKIQCIPRVFPMSAIRVPIIQRCPPGTHQTPSGACAVPL